MKQLRWAVIGSTGYAGDTCVKAALTVAKNCKLVAVQSLTNKVAVRAQSRKHKIPWFTSPEQMLKEVECDAVYVATPQQYHLEHVQLAVSHGCHVFCEKPLARSGAEALKMIQVARRAGLKFGTGFNCRYSSLHEKARKLVWQGALGEIISARCQYGQNYPPDPGAFRQVREAAGGGSMVDMGNHAIDLIEYLTGKKCNRVMAIAPNIVYGYPVEDACAALLEFREGGFAFVDTYYNMDIFVLRNDLEINGTEGTIYTVDTLRGMVTGGTLHWISKKGSRTRHKQFSWDGKDMYEKEFTDFTNSVLRGEEPPCSGLDGLHSQYVLDAIYKSARTGKKVEIKDVPSA